MRPIQRSAFTAVIGMGLAFQALVACRSSVERGTGERGPTLLATAPPAQAPSNEPGPPVMPAALSLKQVYTLNQTAFVPPQCYTKTLDEGGKAHNPCYTCHIASREPNFINDGDVQLEYAFAPRARKNPWTNLFIDWMQRIAAVSDEQILSYIRTSNYFDAQGQIPLAARLKALPSEWDHASDGKWSGFVPDARFNFDAQGFDREPEGTYTGWRAFAYYPVPGTFWPTNGSMGDVLIRLPQPFREGQPGKLDLAIYKTNLSIVEALVTRRSVAIDPIDEASLQVDLDQDGRLGRATRVVFAKSAEGKPKVSYVGSARALAQAGGVHLAEGLYPEGTEFLHTVRYLDPTPQGIRLSARLKELRYAKKTEWVTEALLSKRARVEAISKADSPTELRNFGGDIERGVHNNQGWFFQGFIEDAAGDLRPQSFEENVYCTGCHGGVGANDDAIFSFSRRLSDDAFQQGWYHWSQHGLEGTADRVLENGTTEYVTYLQHNGAGDEFRQNEEVQKRFFDAQGQLDPQMQARLARDISLVLFPSQERALQLNKAYRLLVQEQSFRLGRELVLGGARNVHREVAEGEKTGISAPVEPGWSAKRVAAADVEAPKQ